LCGQTISHRSSHAPLKCSNDCQIAKRNARLADALGINLEARGSDHNNNTNNNKSGGVVYSDEVVGFARVNLKFLSLVEKTFTELSLFFLFFAEMYADKK